MKQGLYFVVCAAVLAGCGGSDGDTGATPYYQGKTIEIVVGFAALGGYDRLARLYVDHWRAFIPGNPAISVFNNEDGTASLSTANAFYNLTAPDGLAIGSFNTQMITQQAIQGIGNGGVYFDAAQFGWIGAPTANAFACGVMAFTGAIDTNSLTSKFEQVKAFSANVNNFPLNFGTTASTPGSSTFDLPTLMNNLAGTNFALVTSYTGTSKIRDALQASCTKVADPLDTFNYGHPERAEVHGACFAWGSMRTTLGPQLAATGGCQFIPFVISDPNVDQWIIDRNVTAMTAALGSDPDVLAAWDMWLKPGLMDRAIVVPPGTPPEVLQILRDSYAAMLNDAGYRAGAAQAAIDVIPKSGPEVEQLVADILATSQTARDKLKSALGL